MHDFKQDLKENEGIVYTCRPTPGKGNKQINEWLFLILLATITQIILLSVSMTRSEIEFDMSRNLVLGVTIIVDLIAISGLIYNYFIKKYKVSDDYFCITTERILKYEERTKKLSCGYIKKYKFVRIRNYKNGYGDIQFDSYVQDIVSKRDISLPNIEDFKQNYEDMDRMVIESVKNPKKIAKIVKKINKKLNTEKI